MHLLRIENGEFIWTDQKISIRLKLQEEVEEEEEGFGGIRYSMLPRTQTLLKSPTEKKLFNF